MASSIVLKRIVSSNLIPPSIRYIRPTASASRLFNTNVARQFDDNEDERGVEVDSRYGRNLPRCRDDFFSDVVDPFWPSRSLKQLLNTMDKFMDNPFLYASRGIGGGVRRGWDVRETDEALKLLIDMPGLDKEDVKVSVEQNTLVIKGEEAKESDVEESGRKYTGRIDLPEKVYRTDQIKAEMKNGVLKVVVPKAKEDERADVFHVKVE